MRSGKDVSNYLPLPEGFSNWQNGTYAGEDILVAMAEKDLFLIAEDTNVGFALFHFVHPMDDGSVWQQSYTLPSRQLQIERSSSTMANPSSLLSMQGAVADARGIAPMDLTGGGSVGAPVMTNAADGVSGSVDPRRLQREAVAYGYVFGYVMNTAPAITMALSKKSPKNSTPVYSIVTKESKPQRPLGVLIALPTRCIMRNRLIATPSEIMAGTVDFNATDSSAMTYQFFPGDAAVGYIGALGGRLPEYAPNVSNAKRQWSPEDILAEKAGVSFVRVHATENKNRTSGSQGQFRFSLKSTSDRRSLYTQHNIMCLRAQVHMPVTCNSEEDAYKLNEAAFGGWRYRKPKTETKSGLDKAIAECPSVIWRKKYTITRDGVPTPVDGIGSVFFMAGQTETTNSGEEVTRRELAYYPWWQTGALRPSSPSIADRIVERKLRPAEGEKKERMIATTVLWKDNPNHPMFKPYATFAAQIMDQGYIREEKLKAMGGRATKSKSKARGLDPSQLQSLKQFLREDDVMAAISSVQDEAADRSVLEEISKK